jgi:Rrf2 family protein
MTNFMKISEAASLAFHTAAYLAQNTDRLVTRHEIARKLGASENHLSKVLQRLVHAGLLRSSRGPSGGFMMRPSWEKIRLMEIYEAIEGPLDAEGCLLDLAACRGNRCALGVLVRRTNESVRKHLAGTTLAELAKGFRLET